MKGFSFTVRGSFFSFRESFLKKGHSALSKILVFSQYSSSSKFRDFYTKYRANPSTSLRVTEEGEDPSTKLRVTEEGEDPSTKLRVTEGSGDPSTSLRMTEGSGDPSTSLRVTEEGSEIFSPRRVLSFGMGIKQMYNVYREG